MVIRGVPKDVDKYFIADGDLAMELHRAGFQPHYMDEEVLYFKINKKLMEYLEKIGYNL